MAAALKDAHEERNTGVCPVCYKVVYRGGGAFGIDNSGLAGHNCWKSE